MQTSFPRSHRLSDYTSIPFEIFIAAFTILPFFVLAYVYPMLPERVPLFLNLNGEVEVWGEKSWLSVFRVPLMAVVTQVLCLLMKYGVLQSEAALPVESADDYARLQKQSTVLNVGLWDWFRCLVAFKMSAASLDTIFLSLERINFLRSKLRSMKSKIGYAFAASCGECTRRDSSFSHDRLSPSPLLPLCFRLPARFSTATVCSL